jgi:hypothetical protein
MRHPVCENCGAAASPPHGDKQLPAVTTRTRGKAPPQGLKTATDADARRTSGRTSQWTRTSRAADASGHGRGSDADTSGRVRGLNADAPNRERTRTRLGRGRTSDADSPRTRTRLGRGRAADTDAPRPRACGQTGWSPTAAPKQRGTPADAGGKILVLLSILLISARGALARSDCSHFRKYALFIALAIDPSPLEAFASWGAGWLIERQNKNRRSQQQDS